MRTLIFARFLDRNVYLMKLYSKMADEHMDFGSLTKITVLFLRKRGHCFGVFITDIEKRLESGNWELFVFHFVRIYWTVFFLDCENQKIFKVCWCVKL
jgi:hypothetical protein